MGQLGEKRQSKLSKDVLNDLKNSGGKRRVTQQLTDKQRMQIKLADSKNRQTQLG